MANPSKNIKYLSVYEVMGRLKEEGIKVSLNSVKHRIDTGMIYGAIRDEADVRKRRLVPFDAMPSIIDYYQKIDRIREGEDYTLSHLARDCSLESKYLLARANKIGIKTMKIGNFCVMEKKEYDKWRIYFGAREKYKKKYVTTGFIGRAWGISHFLVDYYIKRGKIPGKKIGKRYFISREAFNTEGEKWKDECLNKTYRKKALEEKI